MHFFFTLLRLLLIFSDAFSNPCEGEDAMKDEISKALVKKFCEACEKGDLQSARQMVAEQP